MALHTSLLICEVDGLSHNTILLLVWLITLSCMKTGGTGIAEASHNIVLLSRCLTFLIEVTILELELAGARGRRRTGLLSNSLIILHYELGYQLVGQVLIVVNDFISL